MNEDNMSVEIAQTESNEVYEPVATPPADTTTTREVQQLGFTEVEPNAFRAQAEKMQRENQTVTENSLREDPYFIEASRNLMKHKMPDDFDFMSDEEIIASSLGYLGQLNYNIPAAISAAVEFDTADETTLASMAYLLDSYDQKDISWQGTGRLALGLATDPSSYFSAATLGLGTVAQTAGKLSARQLLKQSLLKTGNILAIEGGLYSGGADVIDQDIRTDVGLQEGYDPVQGAITTAFGLGAGKFLGEVPGFIGKTYKEGEKLAGEAAGGGEYKMLHTSPEPEGANSGFDVSDIYPDDVFDPKFERYYGTGDKISDKESIKAMKLMANNPDATVTIYRAAPKGAPINEGDWITLSKNYAKQHGESFLESDFDIISKEVKAQDVYTNGDSINEWGYHPQEEGNK